MVSNSASDDGSTDEVSSSLGLFYHVPLINLELVQREMSLAINKKRTNAKREMLHTYQAATSVASFSKLSAFYSAAAFSSKLAAFSSAFAAAHCSSSPNDASTGLVQRLAICPKIPHLLHLCYFFTRPSSPALILFFLGLPGGLVSTGDEENGV